MDKSDERDDDEEEEKEEEEEEEDEPYIGAKVLDKECITAVELEEEMTKVLCHAYDICLLWVSYTRARGELMKLSKTRNPKNKGALRRDLTVLKKRYSKKHNKTKRFGPFSMAHHRWIIVLKSIMMVQVQEYKLPWSPPTFFVKGRNLIVERARKIYNWCQFRVTPPFENLCFDIIERIEGYGEYNLPTATSIPRENIVQYNEWFKLQPEYKEWSEEDLKKVEEVEEKEEDKKPAAK